MPNRPKMKKETMRDLSWKLRKENIQGLGVVNTVSASKQDKD